MVFGKAGSGGTKAGSLSSGIKEFYLLGGMVKRFHGGNPAEDGAVAALLVHRGFTGPPTVLEGKFGYCKAFSDKPISRSRNPALSMLLAWYSSITLWRILGEHTTEVPSQIKALNEVPPRSL